VEEGIEVVVDKELEQQNADTDHGNMCGRHVVNNIAKSFFEGASLCPEPSVMGWSTASMRTRRQTSWLGCGGVLGSDAGTNEVEKALGESKKRFPIVNSIAIFHYGNGGEGIFFQDYEEWLLRFVGQGASTSEGIIVNLLQEESDSLNQLGHFILIKIDVDDAGGKVRATVMDSLLEIYRNDSVQVASRIAMDVRDKINAAAGVNVQETQ
jgi:hypothetical protein